MSKTPKFALDIGSTVIKLARLTAAGGLGEQAFHPRDHRAGIPAQVRAILAATDGFETGSQLKICSSANGGLRVGIVCLTPEFSGAVLRNQVLLAGANPVYVLGFEEADDARPVDILLLGGGIDDADCAPMRTRLDIFDPDALRFDALFYAGNSALVEAFTAHRADTRVVANPLADGLRASGLTVFEAIRDAYLEDLVHKDGVSELRREFGVPIRPTPEVVNLGFQRVMANRSAIVAPDASVAIDIGGATTDLHYAVEIVKADSEHHPDPALSVARYVFADLGIVASRESTLMQMRAHPRIYEFLCCVAGGDVGDIYRDLREGTLEASPRLLSYACFFIALERFSAGRGPGLPSANLARVGNILLTGGAAQALDPVIVAGLFGLMAGTSAGFPEIIVDSDYQLWIDGITQDG